jgi:CheY-like chemotaxis protein
MTTIWRPTRGSHAVQFYERAPSLHRAVAAFLGDALTSGESAAMIARRETYDAVLVDLAGARDPRLASARDRIVFVDADDALRRIMDRDEFLPARLEALVSGLVRDAQGGGHGGTIRLYGEMVHMLCARGQHAAAVRLEQLWTAILPETPIALLCGYALDDFRQGAHASAFQAVCEQHTRIVPIDAAPDRPCPDARTIYVIDDDASMRRSLARLLGAVDYQVRTYASAEAFLSDVDSAASGCLVMDVQLIGMSGSDLQTRMAASDWQMPVIAMSGSHNTEIEEEALRRGARAFLGKPFDAQDLLDAVARALSRA